MSTYVSLIVLPLQLTSGIILDKCGRKVPIAVCCFLGSAAVAALPYGQGLYPGYFLIQVALRTSLQILSVSPLLADYVRDSTKGLAGSYSLIAAGVCIIIYSFVFLQLAESIDLAYIVWMAGVVLLSIAIYCSIFIVNLRPSTSLHN